MRDKILSIQSKLVYGYVGSNIAELIIELHGLDPISLPTVYLAAHTGHQPIRGTLIEQELFEQYTIGVKELGVIPGIANMITGYIGSTEIMEAAIKFIKEIKSEYPDRLYICDPVMGDNGGLYIGEEIAQKLINDLIPLADIITPNHFEIEYILGGEVRSKEQLLERVEAMPILKGKTIVVTSCVLDGMAEDELNILVVRDNEINRVVCRKVNLDTTGTGDFFTALLASQLAKGVEIIDAVTNASRYISRALEFTVEQGNEEMTAASILYALEIHTSCACCKETHTSCAY